MSRKLASFALVLGILAMGFSPATANAAARQSLNLLGAVADAEHPIGSPDPFTDVTIDGGLTWRPAIVSRLHPWVTVAGTNAWLNCESLDPNDTLGSCSTTLPVKALFRYRFWVASDFANTTFTGHFDVDNEANVYLNGLEPSNLIVGPLPGAVDTFVPEFSIQSLMVPGWNTMYVNLQDFGGLSGINYNLTISLDSDTPIQLASPGSQVNFDARGGEVDIAQKTVAPGAFLSTITFPTPTRAGYSFDGWFTEPTAGQLADLSFAQALKPTNDMTLYARWTPVSYNILFDEQGGTVVPDGTYVIGDTVTLPQAPTREGFTFAGWFDSSTGGNLLGNSVQLTGTGTVTFFAQWTANPEPEPEGEPGPEAEVLTKDDSALATTGLSLLPFLGSSLLLIGSGVALRRFGRKAN